MSATLTGRPTDRAVPRRPPVTGALARVEARRLLRNPVPWLCLAFSTWAMWSTAPEPGEWPGASYESMTLTVTPLLFGISVAVAVQFHRARHDVAPAAPVREDRRALAGLLAALPLLLLTAGFAGLMAWRERDLGGLWLGMEPGRTTHALHSTAELVQLVALGVVAVALGAAAGRRIARVVALVPALFVLWFVVSIYWLFAAPEVTPFSVIQVQPVHVVVGPPTADPMSFPSDWLLVGGPHSEEGWARQLVSEVLAWWHVVWLLGLSSLLLAAAWPRSRRRALLVVGLVLATAGVVGQQVVIP